MLDELQDHVGAFLDPPSLTSFSLTSKANHVKHFDNKTCRGYRFPLLCAQWNHVNLLHHVIEDIGNSSFNSMSKHSEHFLSDLLAIRSPISFELMLFLIDFFSERIQALPMTWANVRGLPTLITRCLRTLEPSRYLDVLALPAFTTGISFLTQLVSENCFQFVQFLLLNDTVDPLSKKDIEEMLKLELHRIQRGNKFMGYVPEKWEIQYRHWFLPAAIESDSTEFWMLSLGYQGNQGVSDIVLERGEDLDEHDVEVAQYICYWLVHSHGRVIPNLGPYLAALCSVYIVHYDRSLIDKTFDALAYESLTRGEVEWLEDYMAELEEKNVTIDSNQIFRYPFKFRDFLIKESMEFIVGHPQLSAAFQWTCTHTYPAFFSDSGSHPEFSNDPHSYLEAFQVLWEATDVNFHNILAPCVIKFIVPSMLPIYSFLKSQGSPGPTTMNVWFFSKVNWFEAMTCSWASVDDIRRVHEIWGAAAFGPFLDDLPSFFSWLTDAMTHSMGYSDAAEIIGEMARLTGGPIKKSWIAAIQRARIGGAKTKLLETLRLLGEKVGVV